ncbi:MAG: hypothetical protein EXR98_19335 [Gemmataceae bacterium]|nr:hypothetical protein [Gemmataceae bacterium]
MAQEDKGLVLRGLLLLAGIGVLVAIVLGILFMRTPPVQPLLVGDPGADAPPSSSGSDIRYNAAATLARRGSASVPWPLIREMLDEKVQMSNHRVRLADGRHVYDEAAARATLMTALRALAAWHEKQPDKNVSPPAEVYLLVDKLTASPFGELKIQAEKTRATFFRAKL